MSKSARSLNKLAIRTVALLVIQYALGMLINLYVQFPENGTVAQNWEFMHGQWLIWAHLLIGTVVVVMAITLFVKAVREENRLWKMVGGISAGSVMLAWLSGEEFVSRQAAAYSLAMSLFFIVALVSLGVGLYVSHKR